jgi:hypothetical protein
VLTESAAGDTVSNSAVSANLRSLDGLQPSPFGIGDSRLGLDETELAINLAADTIFENGRLIGEAGSTLLWLPLHVHSSWHIVEVVFKLKFANFSAWWTRITEAILRSSRSCMVWKSQSALIVQRGEITAAVWLATWWKFHFTC